MADFDEQIIIAQAREIARLRNDLHSLNQMRTVIEERRRGRTLSEALDAIDDAFPEPSAGTNTDPYTAGARAARKAVRAVFDVAMPQMDSE